MTTTVRTSGSRVGVTVRDQLQVVVARLIDDYSEDLAVGSVIRCAARCTEAVSRAQVPRAEMADAVERLARSCLDSRVGTGSWVPLPSAWRDGVEAPQRELPHSRHASP